MANLKSMRRESVLNFELSDTAATSVKVNFQISQHEANRDLRLDDQMNSILHVQFSQGEARFDTESLDNGAETVPNTQLDKLTRRPYFGTMDPTSTGNLKLLIIHSHSSCLESKACY